MDKEKALKLVTRLKEIKIERDKLDTEYNGIVQELWDMIPSLKDDHNIGMKKVKELGQK